MDSFFVAFNAVVPFFIYFAFGYGIRMTGLVDKPFLVRLNQMIFKVFFPVMMFNNIYRIDAGTLVNPLLVGVNILCVFAVIGCAMLVVPRLVKENSIGVLKIGRIVSPRCHNHRDSPGINPFHGFLQHGGVIPVVDDG